MDQSDDDFESNYYESDDDESNYYESDDESNYYESDDESDDDFESNYYDCVKREYRKVLNVGNNKLITLTRYIKNWDYAHLCVIEKSEDRVVIEFRRA